MTDIASLKIKVDTGEVKSGTKDLDNLSSAGGKAGDSAVALSSKFLVAGAALAGVFVTLKQSVDAATKYQNALNGLASVARYAGANVGEAMSESLELTKDGLLSTTEAATALKNLLSRGFSTNEAVEMINRFKDAAAFGRQSSLEFGQAVVSATEGIKNENSVLVDNAGVTKNVSMMWKEYAAQINKSVADLSQAEKRQAEFNGVLAETEGQLGNAALAANGADGANARLNKTFSDMSVTIGQSLTPAYVGLTNTITSGFQAATEYGIKPFLFAFENLGISFGAHIGKMKAFFDVISSPSKWMTGELTRQFKMLEDTAEEMRVGAAGRISGQTVSPVMGADSGKRRQDFVVSGETETVRQLKDLRKKAVDDANKEEVRRLNVAIWVNEQIYNSEFDEGRRQRIAEAVESQKEFNAEVNKIKDSVDPLRAYNEQIGKLAEMFNMGRLTAEEFSAAAGKAQQEMLGFTDAGKTGFEDLERAIDGYARNASSAMADFIFGTKGSFSDMVNSMLKDLARLALQKSIFEPLAKGLGASFDEGGGGIGGWIKSLLPGFANGSEYIPRDMTANLHQGERVLTREENRNYSQGMGGNVSVNVTVNSDGSSSVQSDASFGKQLGNAIKATVQAELLKQKRQGGLLA
jgi:hypothetical protein